MRTSGEIDFRFRLKPQITLVESTYPSQRPECPSLSPHFLLGGCISVSNKHIGLSFSRFRRDFGSVNTVYPYFSLFSVPQN